MFAIPRWLYPKTLAERLFVIVAFALWPLIGSGFLWLNGDPFLMVVIVLTVALSAIGLVLSLLSAPPKRIEGLRVTMTKRGAVAFSHPPVVTPVVTPSVTPVVTPSVTRTDRLRLHAA